MTKSQQSGSTTYSNRLGTLRPSQIITTFGPGAIYDTLDDSVMIMGINFWNDREFSYKKIIDETLLAHLRRLPGLRKVDHFRIPAGSGSLNNVACSTFPTYGECPKCHKITKRDGSVGTKGLSCPDCRIPTHPARLIIACRNGHIDDFPWFQWVTHKKNDCDEKGLLYLRKAGNTVSLAGLEVCCDNCGQSRDLGKALTRSGVRYLVHGCTRRRPWLRDRDPHECEEIPRGLLKGASNVYFADPIRALFIPPYTDRLQTRLRKYWDTLSDIQDDPVLLDNLVSRLFADFDKSEVLKRITKTRDAIDAKIEVDIQKEEWLVLDSKVSYNDEDFKTEIISVPPKYKHLVDKLVLVKRLKETVVLKGFTRIDPPDPISPDHRRRAHISTEEPTWLPAVENYGEGIFFSFRQSFLEEWEKREEVIARNNEIFAEHMYVRKQRNQDSYEIPPPRLILLHTLSHLIIRQLSIDAGYSSASIRERVYGMEGMAGILLYTSSSSSDGSLGGLVSLGNTAPFGQIMDRAVRSAQWCSSDPLCSHHVPSSTHRDNGSACHACCYLPETSCINMNSLLDRRFINTTIADKELGFFSYARSK